MAEALSVDYKVNTYGEQVPLTEQERRIQASRDQWAENNPGQHVELTAEQKQSAQDTANEYAFDRFKRGDVESARQAVQGKVTARESELRAKFEGKAEDFVIEEKVKEKSDLARHEAVVSTLDASLPLPADEKSKEYKKAKALRDKLEAMLLMDEAQYGELQGTWQTYENMKHMEATGNLYEKAQEDDKAIRSKEERNRLGEKLEEFDTKYEGALSPLSELPISTDTGLEIPTGAELDDKGKPRDGYPVAMRLKQLKETLASESDKDLQDLYTAEAFHDIKYRTGVLMSKELNDDGSRKYTDEQIGEITAQNSENLKKWLEVSMQEGADAIGVLKDYENTKRAYEMWDQRRAGAIDYLGPVALAKASGRMLGEKLPRRKAKEKTGSPDSAGTERIRIITDPTGAIKRESARALRTGLDDAGMRGLKGGVRQQLRYAKGLYRNEGLGTSMGGAMSAVAYGMMDNLSSYRNSRAEKKSDSDHSRKKFSLGKASVTSALAKHWAKLKAGDKATAKANP